MNPTPLPRRPRRMTGLVAGAAVLTVAAALLAGCGGSDATRDAAGPSGSGGGGGHHARHAHGQTTSTPSGSPTGTPSSTPSRTPTTTAPAGPPMLLESIAPLSGSTVGVAMPISIVFTDPVATSARGDVERHISLTTSTPVEGAWHWFGPQRLDFRPKAFWPSDTKVSMVADFAGVADGNGRFGTHSYTRDFTVGDDVRTRVDIVKHTTTVTRDGKVLRTMRSNAGSPEFPTWDGTMAVVSTSSSVRMTSCSVGIACSPSDPNYYDLTLPWDVRLTTSGTFVHYSTGDPNPGSGNGSHGCVHLSYSDAEWFYRLSKQGDPVTITGSPRGDAAGDNGYADYNVDWADWLAGSGSGVLTTTTA